MNEVPGQAAADGYAAVTYDDLANLINELDAEYTPDEDIQGGDFAGVARFWLPHKLRGALMNQKDGNGAYLDEARELRNARKVFGFESKRVLTLPGAPVAGQKYGALRRPLLRLVRRGAGVPHQDPRRGDRRWGQPRRHRPGFRENP